MSDVADMLQNLTLEEKAALCSGADFWHTVAISRLGIDSIMLADGPHGLRVQEHAAEHSGTNTSLPATCFPTGAALGSSWNTDLIREVGQALALPTTRKQTECGSALRSTSERFGKSTSRPSRGACARRSPGQSCARTTG